MAFIQDSSSAESATAAHTALLRSHSLTSAWQRDIVTFSCTFVDEVLRKAAAMVPELTNELKSLLPMS